MRVPESHSPHNPTSASLIWLSLLLLLLLLGWFPLDHSFIFIMAKAVYFILLPTLVQEVSPTGSVGSFRIKIYRYHCCGENVKLNEREKEKLFTLYKWGRDSLKIGFP